MLVGFNTKSVSPSVHLSVCTEGWWEGGLASGWWTQHDHPRQRLPGKADWRPGLGLHQLSLVERVSEVLLGLGSVGNITD